MTRTAPTSRIYPWHGIATVLRKERLTQRRHLGAWRWAWHAAFVVMPALYIYGVIVSATDIFVFAFNVLPLLLSVLILIFSSGAFARECEGQAFESLAVTRLTPIDLLIGKTLAYLWPIVEVNLVFMAGAAWFIIHNYESIESIIYDMSLYSLITMVLLGIGLCCSAWFTRTAHARMAAFGLAGLLLATYLPSMYNTVHPFAIFGLDFSYDRYTLMILLVPLFAFAIVEAIYTLHSRIYDQPLTRLNYLQLLLLAHLMLIFIPMLPLIMLPLIDPETVFNLAWLLAVPALFWLTLRRLQRLWREG